MVDGSGLQAVKAAFATAARNVVDVSTRDYYQRALARKQLWALPLPNKSDGVGQKELCSDGCYVGSVSAWTTGRPQVVMSMPTGIPRLPVAALSIPDACAPRARAAAGFRVCRGRFGRDRAVSLGSGSATARRTCCSRPIRTRACDRLSASRSAGTFTTMYWGYPYRGYMRRPVSPAGQSSCSTPSRPARALVVEWFTVAMLLAGLYTVGWVVVMLLFAAARGVMVVAGSAAPALVCAARMPGGRRHGAMAGE